VTGAITITLTNSAVWDNVYIDGKYLASGPPNSFSWNTTTVTDGSHTITAKAYNSSNQQVAADSVTVNVSNGAGVVIKITQPINNTVGGTATIVTQTNSTVVWDNVYIDGAYLASGPPNTFQWDTTTVPNGSHIISAKAFGNGGTLLGTASKTVTVFN